MKIITPIVNIVTTDDDDDDDDDNDDDDDDAMHVCSKFHNRRVMLIYTLKSDSTKCITYVCAYYYGRSNADHNRDEV